MLFLVVFYEKRGVSSPLLGPLCAKNFRFVSQERAAAKSDGEESNGGPLVKGLDLRCVFCCGRSPSGYISFNGFLVMCVYVFSLKKTKAFDVLLLGKLGGLCCLTSGG